MPGNARAGARLRPAGPRQRVPWSPLSSMPLLRQAAASLQNFWRAFSHVKPLKKVSIKQPAINRLLELRASAWRTRFWAGLTVTGLWTGTVQKRCLPNMHAADQKSSIFPDQCNGTPATAMVFVQKCDYKVIGRLYQNLLNTKQSPLI